MTTFFEFVGTTSEAEAISTIDMFIAQTGGGYSHFYIGITGNVGRRLFAEHLVELNSQDWIGMQMSAAAYARNVERHYLTLGCDGGPGGGDDSSRFVYLYRKTPYTQP